MADRAYRVLEVASPATAPCGRLLVEAGLEVVKVQPPAAARPGAVSPDGALSPDDAVAFDNYTLFHDTGKRAITLDLERSEGRNLFLRLAAAADVVLEGDPPGAMTRRGLGYETLSGANPGLVLASLTPFGQDGPYRDFAGNDLVAFAMGGVMFISGEPGRPPVTAPEQQAYVVMATHAALALLALLWGRRSTGHGDWLDVSAFECLAAQENTITNFVGPGKFTRRSGSQHRTANPGRIFACRDGFVHIFVSHQRDAWERFLDWIGRPSELADPALAEINTRWQHADLVTRATEDFVGQHTKAEIYESAQRHHVPVVPVYSPLEFLADPQVVAHNVISEVAGGNGRRYRTLRSPLGQQSPPTPAPYQGEHNDRVYQEWLELSATELEAHRRSGVV